MYKGWAHVGLSIMYNIRLLAAYTLYIQNSLFSLVSLLGCIHSLDISTNTTCLQAMQEVHSILSLKAHTTPS